MKVGGSWLGPIAWMAFHALITLPVPAAAKGLAIADTSTVQIALKTKEAERKGAAATDSELKRLRLEDSSGWDETKVMTKPKDDASPEEKERMQRKAGGLIGLCMEGRFARIADVDSLKGMTNGEKAFCKARLNLINPLMP